MVKAGKKVVPAAVPNRSGPGRNGNGALQRGDGGNMEQSLTTATWFWLLVPMLTCVALSIVTWIMKK